jgi:branched-chain amino acid transport system permease protein
LRGVDESYVLIATFAMLLLCEGIVKQIWGMGFRAVAPPDLLAGAVMIGPIIVPTYSLFIIGAGLLVFVLLELAINKTWAGKLVQSVSVDPWMTSLMGLNVPMLLTGAICFGFFLAGLAGGLLLPNQSLSPNLAHAFLLQAFAAVIIGGLGSIRGAFMAAVLLGLTDSVNAVLVPDVPGLAIYVAMVVFLIVKPNGLIPLAHGR